MRTWSPLRKRSSTARLRVKTLPSAAFGFGVLVLQLLSSICPAAEVRMVEWKSRSTATPVTGLGREAEAWLPTFRLALETLPESAIVALALTQPVLLGLPPDQANGLLPLVSRRYEAMAVDPVYAQVPSALPYCFAAIQPKKGRATVYAPDHLTPATKLLVFLHGYGGSFLWYQHYLSERFPDRVILCPAFGISGGSMSAGYVREAIRAAQAQFGWKPTAPPDLVGLSAGGFGASVIFNSSRSDFRSLLVLAAYPPAAVETAILARTNAAFLAGDQESFVLDGRWRRWQEGQKRRPEAGALFSLVPGGGHFFILTHPEETTLWLRERLK